ncbi:MAG: hypothetical protein ABIR17_10320 [Pseudolysinimonas sp.]|uniref:hypothetical protein n=1 Tax=Pseudolysinimonas sp. TaxID=2680009 RepID=UPI003266B175
MLRAVPELRADELPSADPLREDGALAEVGLIDVRHDLLTSEVWLLLDCHGALQIDKGSTAVLVVQDATEFIWNAPSRGSMTWWTILGWHVAQVPAGISFTAGMFPDGQFTVTGESASFYVGDTPEGLGPILDMAESRPNEVRESLPQWTSEFTLLASTHS